MRQTDATDDSGEPKPKPKYIAFESGTRIGCINFIDENENKGYRLSTISYNEHDDKYLILMNYNPSEITSMKWFEDDDEDVVDGSIDDVVDSVSDEEIEEDQKSSFQKACLWMEENMKENFYPYLIFKDPMDNKTLISLTNRELGLSDVDLILNANIKPDENKDD